MLKTRIIPTLLIKDVGLVKGERFDSWRRVGAPMQAVKVYNTRDVDELIVLDIDATREGREPDYDLIGSLARECFVPLCVGGGVCSIDIVRQLLRSGADKVCINTAAYESPRLISATAESFGAQCIVAAIDARPSNGGYECYRNCGRTPTGRNPSDWARELEALGAGEILVTSIERDGTMTGYDLELAAQVSSSVKIPVIVSGGAGSYEDMVQAIRSAGVSAVAASSLYLFTQSTPLEAKAYLAERGIPVRNPQRKLESSAAGFGSQTEYCCQASSVRTVAIIQARMGSSRLPGKVLLPLGGQPVLAHVVARVRASNVLDEVVVATSSLPSDDVVAELGEALGTAVFRGSEADVLSRYARAATAVGADVIVRVTADCPLIDPDVLADMVERFWALQRRERPIHVLTNSRIRSFPRGLDVEIFTRDALDTAAAEAVSPRHREHVTPYFYENPDRFLIVDHVGLTDYSRYRLTLDTVEDYELLRRIAEAVPAAGLTSLRMGKIVDLLSEHPNWLSINAHIPQRLA
jgi:cyclase